MKHIFLSLLALLVMIGCTSNSVNDELMEIETLMDSDPEMALRELDSILFFQKLYLYLGEII